MNDLLLGNTMSLWLLVVGLLHKSYWPVEVPSSSPPHMSGEAACSIMWTCITHPTLRWKTEKAHRFKSSGIWCPCNCTIKITHKAHAYHRSATQPSPKKVPKTKHTINILLLLLLLCGLPIFFIGWFSPSLWGIISNHTACNYATCEPCKVFTKFNTW